MAEQPFVLRVGFVSMLEFLSELDYKLSKYLYRQFNSEFCQTGTGVTFHIIIQVFHVFL